MDGKDGEYNMIIDGADLQGVLATPGINWKKTFSNHTPKVKSIHILYIFILFRCLNVLELKPLE